jgi:hypothetical protein
MEFENESQQTWIQRLGFSSLNTKSFTSSISLESVFTGNNYNYQVYWTAIYFITTTICTIGYGDIYGVLIYEKEYLMFLLFTGILIFSNI